MRGDGQISDISISLASGYTHPNLFQIDTVAGPYNQWALRNINSVQPAVGTISGGIIKLDGANKGGTSLSAALGVDFGRAHDVTSEYRVAGTKVIGARDTGWTAMTGTGSKGALAAAAAGTASVGYVQAELQGALNRVAALEARLKSYDAALFAHGQIGT